MSQILQDVSAPGLLSAMDENAAAYWLRRARLAGWEIREENGVTWYRSGLLAPLTNGVARAMLDARTADAAITKTLAHFTRRNLPAAWYVGPALQPDDLGARLEARGLRRLGSEPGMAVNLHELREDLPAPDGLAIERVRDAETLAIWLRTYRLGEGVPPEAPPIPMESCVPRRFDDVEEPMRLFLARLNGQPVATAQVLLAAGVAGIYGVATAPGARRQGIGGAVTLAALRHAHALGYRIGVLHATQLGHGVYRRLGFMDYCVFSLYAWRPRPAQ